jgi:MATE family multidrug resistance protein
MLDYLLIVRLGWESAGAGFATAISQYLMLLIGIIFLCREVRWKEIQAVSGQLFDLSTLKETLTLNRDIFIRTFAFLSTFSIFTNLSSGMGTMTLTENALLLQVVTLAIYFIDGLAFATESLSAFFAGKEDHAQLTSLVGISGGTALILGLSLALVFVLFPEPLFGLLTNHSEVIDSIGALCFLVTAPFRVWFDCFYPRWVFFGLSRGANDS